MDRFDVFVVLEKNHEKCIGSSKNRMTAVRTVQKEDKKVRQDYCSDIFDSSLLL